MDVAEELLDVDRTIDRSYVERRLQDWHCRLDRLYADIAAWLPEGWSLRDGGTVPIHEDLMTKFEVPSRTLPSKDLLRHGEKVGRIEPRGLWIIGANGRVDLVSRAHHAIIVDRSDSFERPQWTIMPFRDRLDRRAFTEETLRASLD